MQRRLKFQAFRDETRAIGPNFLEYLAPGIFKARNGATIMFEIQYKSIQNDSRLLGHILDTRDKIYWTYKDSILGYILYICSYSCCVCIAVASSRTFKIQENSLELRLG